MQFAYDYDTFFRKFGASARTKNLLRSKSAEGAAKKGRPDGRRHSLPSASLIPLEFIRLCPWEMEYLFCVARRARVGIIETGRCHGGSLFVMACAAPLGVPIHSVDIKPRDDEQLRAILDEHCKRASVDIIVGDSQKTKYTQIGEADLLFVDGDHTYEGCMNDITNWYGNLVPGGHMVFHDAYLGRHGVQDAIADFQRGHPELETIKSPYIGATYWHYPAGSICHLIKRA